MKKLALLLFTLYSCVLYSQGEANNWFFGQNAGLDFNNGNVTEITGSLSTTEGCASFSDVNGDLLFYTDGISVWNKNHNKMPNGSGLFGDPSSTQSAIIVPNPSNPDLYFIFTVGANDYDNDGNLIQLTEGVHSYTVDMSLDGGLGDVVGSGTNLSGTLSGSWTEKITSVKGSECNTFWVITLVKNTFYSFKVDASGLNTTPVISHVDFEVSDPRGYLKVSPDGKKIASATYGEGKLLLYSFNDITGVVSNDGISLMNNRETDGDPYGIEFSPNSSKLYCSSHIYGNNINNLFQFDLSSVNIPNSKYLISSQVGFRGGLQLAPNGKIYAVVPQTYYVGTQFLNAINLPDELQDNCSFELRSKSLGAGTAMQGLPPFIASLLLPVEITDGHSTVNLNNTVAKRCIGEDYSLTAQNIQGIPSYKWLYNGTTISTSATLLLPNLAQTSEGEYIFEAETIDNCGFTITYKGKVTLEVYEPPTINKPSNIETCDTDTDGFYDFDLNSLLDSEVLGTQDPGIFEVVYFANQSDADLGVNPLPNPYTNSSPHSNETLVARIQNMFNPICFETETFTIEVFEKPNPPASISNLTMCDTNGYGTDIDGMEFFDLTEKQSELLNGQSIADFDIQYFTDVTLTNQIIDPSNFRNTTPHIQPIFVQITNKLSNSCEASLSFNVEVFSLPVIQNTFTLMQCDEDGISDGLTNFNLAEANDYLTNGNPNLTVTYHLTSTDAETKNNILINAPFSNSIQTAIFARIENENNCFRVALVDLFVSATHFDANYLKTVEHCDDDSVNDGRNLFDLNEISGEMKTFFPSGQNLTVHYFRNFEDAQLEMNEIPLDQPYLNEVPFNQTLYVRVESEDNGECFGLGPHLNLQVTGRPEFELNETAIYCQNLPPKIISTFNPQGAYSYTWTNEQGDIVSTLSYMKIENEGVYTVIATDEKGCESFPKIITIEPSVIASISENDITIVDDSLNNTITISTTNLGIGDYEFSLNDNSMNFQDEPFFENVPAGIHTIYIRDKNNCGTAQLEVSVLGFPNFFTPNNDGFNDTWSILGVNENFYTNSEIHIFDRFGKLITSINPKENGWDGFLNGVSLPSTDYWFTAQLVDKNGNIRIRKGHFSLIR